MSYYSQPYSWVSTMCCMSLNFLHFEFCPDILQMCHNTWPQTFLGRRSKSGIHKDYRVFGS